ncbi:hypothetical protein KFL_001000120 [Klebsormidium nitens]|uniref:Uncharacterized protein n=1 Tax=Klebsormidium nitens TaxID=105231 RepID=A0A1Y1HTY8_KLENI|nr:hypothetical protein KFL_001000120 [Klebsormidium nitens]|eukprot:GAQ82090.1 hypothetical protein KFL_001000120 [Klebsormidium nitens]
MKGRQLLPLVGGIPREMITRSSARAQSSWRSSRTSLVRPHCIKIGDWQPHPLVGMAAEGLVPDAPGGLGFHSAEEAAAKLDANNRKRLGDASTEGDAERRVRPRLELPPESAQIEQAGGQEDADAEGGPEDELDKRLRALVEVAAQRKGDSPLPKPPHSLFQASVPIPFGTAAPPASASLNLPTQEALGRGRVGELPSGLSVSGASGEAILTGGFLAGAPDGLHSYAAARQPLPSEDRLLSQPPDHPQSAQHPSQALTPAEPLGPDEDVPISQLQGRPERLRAGEGGGNSMQIKESAEHDTNRGTEDHGFGHEHGFTQHEYAGYGEHPQYEPHQQYAATAEAQQLAEHAGFGGGHMEQEEDEGALAALDLVEVGFPRSSVEELQTLPQHDLITRVLDLEERISAVVREKQLEAAARQEAEDNAARYAEESRHLRHVVREKNGYKKGVLQEIAALENPLGIPQLAGRFTITREGSPGGGLRLEKGNKGRSLSPVKEKWKAEWKKAASRSHYVPSASLLAGAEFGNPYAGLEELRNPANVKGARSRKVGPSQATPASRLLAILGAQDDDDDDEDGDNTYVAPIPPPPRLIGPVGPAPTRAPRAESTVGLEDLSEFLRTCCQAKQTGHMTLHRVLWYTYLAWRQKIASPRPSVSSGGVGLSQCMQKLGHRERLFTREIQAKKAGCKGYEGGGKYWMGLVVLDKALVKTGRQWLAEAKRSGGSNRVTFSRDAAIKVQASKDEPADEQGAQGEAAAEA